MQLKIKTMNKEKLKDYFYSNIATIFWSLFLLIGGGIFVAYYAYIEYMPDFDLKSSVAITAASAATALILMIILLVVMVLPGSFWGNTWGKESKLRRYWTDENNMETITGLLVWFAIPMALIYVAAIVSYYISWYSLSIILTGFIGYFFYAKSKSDLSSKEVLKEVIGQYGAALVASIFIFIPLYFIFSLSIQPGQNLKIQNWAAGLMTGAFIIFVNVLAATTPKNIKPLYWYVGLSAVALFLILYVFGKTHRIPVGVMELYKFGNIPASQLVLKKGACKVFESLNIKIRKVSKEYCVAKNIVILSRLGKEAYLKYLERDMITRFTVKSSDILSWSIKTESKTSNKTIQQTPKKGAADG